MIPLFCGIRWQFRKAFIDVYLELRTRLLLYFIFGQSIILIRDLIYFRINYHEINPDSNDYDKLWVRIY